MSLASKIATDRGRRMMEAITEAFGGEFQTDDVITDLLHYAESQLAEEFSGDDLDIEINDVVDTAVNNWRAERGEGDDIANDPSMR